MVFFLHKKLFRQPKSSFHHKSSLLVTYCLFTRLKEGNLFNKKIGIMILATAIIGLTIISIFVNNKELEPIRIKVRSNSKKF
jgi:hypothetical protein